MVEHLLFLGHVLVEVGVHAVTMQLPLPEDWLHLLVRDDERLVLGILKVLLLGVLPELLDDLSLGQFLSFLSSNQSSKLGAEVEWTGFVRHL